MKRIIVLLIVLGISFYSCSVVKQMVNVSRLKYKLDNVTDFRLSGINLSNKTSIKDFSIPDGISLGAAIAQKKLPVNFVLNILATNPNNEGGYEAQDVDIVDFKWRLFIDNVETINGNIANPIKVPGKGQSTRFGLTIGFDLYQYFSEKGYDGLLNLALKLGGQESKASNIKLKVLPTIRTMLGDIQSPNEIEIIDTDFR